MPCCWCQQSFTKRNPKTREHLIPVALGGRESDWENIDAACERCNNERSHLTNVFLAKVVTRYAYRANHTITIERLRYWIDRETAVLGHSPHAALLTILIGCLGAGV